MAKEKYWIKSKKGDAEMISIDGDLYGMTVPRLNKWRDLLKLLGTGETQIGETTLGKDWFDNNILTYQWAPLIDNNRTGEFHILGSKSSILGYMKKEQGVPELIFSNATGPIGWRPVLVPLDESGSFFDERVLASTPDGFITHGGTLYVNGKPAKPETDWMLDSEDVRIGDTYSPEYELSWSVIGGRLVCSKVLCHVDVTMFHLVPLIEWLEEGSV